jgi:uncharacterized DUF497 family protein
VINFIWDKGNVDHIAKHGVTRDEAEYVVERAAAPYPSYEGDRKWLVRGKTRSGRYLQVIYVLESDAAINYSEIDLVLLSATANGIYVIHARPLNDSEKRRLRRRRRHEGR